MAEQWGEDQLTVLLAVFCAQPFAAGDDSNPTCHELADALHRGTGAIDRQWRNVRKLLYGAEEEDVGNVGNNVREVVERFRSRTVELAGAARDACERQNWNVAHLLPETDSRTKLEPDSASTDPAAIAVLLETYITQPRTELGLPAESRIDNLADRLSLTSDVARRTLRGIHACLHAGTSSDRPPPSSLDREVHEVVLFYRDDFGQLRDRAQEVLSSFREDEPAAPDSNTSNRGLAPPQSNFPTSVLGGNMDGRHWNDNARELLEHRLEGRLSTAQDKRAEAGISAVYIETGLDNEDLRERVSSRKYRLVVVLGTPGDGKSEFLKRFTREKDQRDRSYAVRHDAAFSDSNAEDAEINATKEFLEEARVKSNEREASSEWEEDGAVALLGINRGLYDELFRKDKHGYRWVHEGGMRTDSDVLVLDLGRRYALGGRPNESIFAKLLRGLTAEEHWEESKNGSPCKSCEHEAHCPILWNVRTLRNPEVIESLRGELARVVLRGKRRPTIRDLWDYAAQCIAAHPDAYTKEGRRIHPCLWVDTHESRLQEAISNSRERSEIILRESWRLLPNLAWGETAPDRECETLLYHEGAPRSSGLIGALGAELAESDPAKLPTKQLRSLEIQASIDPRAALSELTENSDLAQSSGPIERLLGALRKLYAESGEDDDQRHRVLRSAIHFRARYESLGKANRKENDPEAILSLLIRSCGIEAPQADGELHDLDHYAERLGIQGWENNRAAYLADYCDRTKKKLLRALALSDYHAPAAAQDLLRLRRSEGAEEPGTVELEIAAAEISPPALEAGCRESDLWLDAMPTYAELAIPTTATPVNLRVDFDVLEYLLALLPEHRALHPFWCGGSIPETLRVFKERLRISASRRVLRVGSYKIELHADAGASIRISKEGP